MGEAEQYVIQNLPSTLSLSPGAELFYTNADFSATISEVGWAPETSDKMNTNLL